MAVVLQILSLLRLNLLFPTTLTKIENIILVAVYLKALVDVDAQFGRVQTPLHFYALIKDKLSVNFKVPLEMGLPAETKSALQAEVKPPPIIVETLQALLLAFHFQFLQVVVAHYNFN